MLTSFGWVCFGMAVWGLCILMQSLQRRFAPELGAALGLNAESGESQPREHRYQRGSAAEPRNQEIAELKQRIETLEAIITDRRYQWEQELRRS